MMDPDRREEPTPKTAEPSDNRGEGPASHGDATENHGVAPENFGDASGRNGDIKRRDISAQRCSAGHFTGRRPRVAIIGAPDRDRVREELRRLRPAIESRATIVVEDLEFAHDFGGTEPSGPGETDMVIVLGGDGSILQSARQMGRRQRPVLGVNCGHLGFLAALTPDRFLTHWPTIAAGNFRVVPHLMLDVELIRDGRTVGRSLALNEAAILGGPPYQILDIDLYADDELATRYRCDGLIIATPVGSTAHNLSAGGPILRRSLQAVVISPISPHTLTYRPVVDTADTRLELVAARPNDSTSIVVDGRVLDRLYPGDRVRIRRADVAFQLIAVPGHSDYRALREKLNWGGTVPRFN